MQANQVTKGTDAEQIEIMLDRALFQKSYVQFFLEAWKQVETVDLNTAWYITYICNRVQAAIERVGKGEKRQKHLIICIAPRTGKSYIVTKFLNAWAWSVFPHLKFITASYSDKLTEDHAGTTKTLIASEWYQKRFGGVFGKGAKDTLTWFTNDKGGARLATSVGGSVTGFGGDILIGDDLLDPFKAFSEAERDTVIRWVRGTFMRRLNDKERGLMIFMQQRVHDNDPVGWLLKTIPEEFEVINIPAELGITDSAPRGKYKVSPDHLRKHYEMGFMDAKRFGPVVLAGERKVMLEKDYDAQYGQSTSKDGGNMIKRSWFRRYKFAEILERAEAKGITLVMNYAGDTAYTKKQSNSATVFLACFEFEGNLYIYDRLKVHQEITELVSVRIGNKKEMGSLEKFVRTSGYTNSSIVMIEPKASGLDIIATMRKHTGLNIVAYEQKNTDKVTAVRSCTPVMKSGRIYLPEDSEATWVENFLEEMESFKDDLTHDKDDQVDTLVSCIKEFLIPTLTDGNAGGVWSTGVVEDWEHNEGESGLDNDGMLLLADE